MPMPKRALLLAGSVISAGALVSGGLFLRWRARTTFVLPPDPPHVVGQVPVPGLMVRIPGGTYRMGSNDGFFEEEKPVHEVRVDDFDLDVTEVTVAAYSACVRSGACTPAPLTVYWTEVELEEQNRVKWAAFCNGDRPERQDHPVNCIEWGQADTYCRSVGKRLPTEEEWEYAARGGSEQRMYAWGNEPPSSRLVNFCGIECSPVVSTIRRWGPLYPDSDGWLGTAPVGSFPAGNGKWGLQDMSGNVQEWLSSRYCPYPDLTCAEPMRTARGGGWLGNQLHKMRVARRNKDVEAHKSGDVGVRCAKSAGPASPTGAPAPAPSGP